MTYQTPRTWTTGETVTAAHMNQDVRDNITECSKGSVTFLFDGGGAAVTTDTRLEASEAPFKLAIDSSTLKSLDGTTGDMVVDIWVPVASSNAAADTDSITASAPPTISCDTYAQDTTLTGWTKVVDEGDAICAYVESCADITLASLTLTYTRSS